MSLTNIFKLKLDTPILDNKGQEIFDTEKVGKTEEKVKRTIREDLLKVLGIQYDGSMFENPKQYTWVYNMANQFNGKENEVEISDQKREFLKKLVEFNKAIIFKNNAIGQPEKMELPVFSPFEVGQLLVSLGEED